jgi:hypothetical protein
MKHETQSVLLSRAHLVRVVLTFLSGAAVEATAVFWVHYSSHGQAFAAGAFSMLQAMAMVFGIGESVRDRYAAPAFVLGYGAGTAVAVALAHGTGVR